MPEIRYALPKGVILAGDYKIEDYLGSGGFGITYRATDIELGHEVAIKEYFPKSFAHREDSTTVRATSQGEESDYDWGLDRFLNEARTLVKLNHPNVVRAIRFFRENNTAYLVQEFLQGHDMEDWLTSRKRTLDQDAIDRLLGPILSAMEEVHNSNILHRDIKPANIFIRKSDNAPLIIDFGASRYSIGEHTGTTALIASPHYSPNEAFARRSNLQGEWTDIYSLGATFYRVLTGAPPNDSTLRMIEDDYVPLGKALDNAESYRPSFLAAIDKALAVMPKDRPQTIAEFRDLLFSSGAAEQPEPVKRPAGGGKDNLKSGKESEARETPGKKPVNLAGMAHGKTDGGGVKWAAAAAIILALTGGGYSYWKYKQSHDPVVADQQSADENGKSGTQEKTRENSSEGTKELARDELPSDNGKPPDTSEPKSGEGEEREPTTSVARDADPSEVKCDRLAADWPDPQAVARFVELDDMRAIRAIRACEKAVKEYPDIARFKHQLAYALYGDRRYDHAIELFGQLAEQGYRPAMRRLGYAYYNGNGVSKDEEKGVEWLTKAAEEGDGVAAFVLGERYEKGGDTLTEDAEAAKRWYLRALELYERGAEEKLYHAAHMVGEMHEFGNGVEKSYETARSWYLRSAEDDENPVSMERLGLIYQHARGTEENFEEAFRWYKAAAERGSGLGMNQTGYFYHQGLGVGKDEQEAVGWYQKGAEAGNGVAMSNLAWCYDNGSGLETNPEEAGYWYLESYLHGEELDDISKEATKAMQERMKAEDIYDGETDGELDGEDTQTALKSYYSKHNP